MALSVQSSTLMNVAAQLAVAHRSVGGESIAVLSDNRGVSLPVERTHLVDFTRNCPREWFTRRELAVDVAAGALGRLRPFYGRMYDPAVDALAADPTDIVLLYEGHYASATLPRWQPLRSRSKVCLYVHNPLSRTYRAHELRRLLASADRVIFCAEHLRAGVEARLGRSDPRFHVVPNGVEDTFFASEPRRRPEGFEIVFAGRLSEPKGVHVLLDAVAELEHHPELPALRVTIVGGSDYGGSAASDYERRLRARAKTLVSEVEFVGWATREQTAAVFQRASVIAIPSLWDEGLPLVALEAMAAGAPVAVSDSAGLVEAVGEVGTVHRMGDAGGLAAGLRALATGDGLWRARSDAGRARAREFTWTRAVERIVAAASG